MPTIDAVCCSFQHVKARYAPAWEATLNAIVSGAQAAGFAAQRAVLSIKHTETSGDRIVMPPRRPASGYARACGIRFLPSAAVGTARSNLFKLRLRPRSGGCSRSSTDEHACDATLPVRRAPIGRTTWSACNDTLTSRRWRHAGYSVHNRTRWHTGVSR